MELTLFGSVLFTGVTLVSVLFLALVVLKFFYISPFYQMYDFIDEMGKMMIVMWGIVALSVIAWVSYFTESQFGIAITVLLASITLFVLSIIGTISLVIYVIIPWFSETHRRIRTKRGG